MWNLASIAVGLVIARLATTAFQLAGLNPVAWMIAVGAGLYLAYTPFNALLLDRLVAATAARGNTGCLIYVADANGYVGSVALLVSAVSSMSRCAARRFCAMVPCDVRHRPRRGGIWGEPAAAQPAGGRYE